MPTPVIKSLAKKYGKSISSVENKWEKVKKGLSKSIPESDPKFYAILVATLKKSLNKE